MDCGSLFFDVGIFSSLASRSMADHLRATKEPGRQPVRLANAARSADRVRGVLPWSSWNQVEAARALIAQPGPFPAADLMGRLPA